MKHDEPETMYSREWLEHERSKAWDQGYAAGWKDQECDFPQYTSENPYKHWDGYLIRQKGDMRRYTCRMYETLQEASDVAQERADSQHRPYEVLATCDTSQRIIKTIEPRKSK